MNTRLETLFLAVLVAVVTIAAARFVAGVERLAEAPGYRAAVEAGPLPSADPRPASGAAAAGAQSVNCSAASRA